MIFSTRRVISSMVLVGVAFGGGMATQRAFGQSGVSGTSNWNLLGTVASTTQGRVLGIGQSPRITVSDDVQFALFWEEWKMLREKYYKQPVDDKALFYGAMAGMAEGVGDPYTAFFEPKGAEAFDNQLAGTFEGIGAQIEVKDGLLQVISPLDGSPAQKAGLRSRDWIAKIDQKSTEGLTAEQAVDLIRGPKGTAVTLTIVRSDRRQKPLTITIVRDQIQTKSVKLTWLPNGIARVDLTGFNNDTASLFASAEAEIVAKKAKGIILDLRGNPGGHLTTAQAVAGAWVGSQPVLKERRQGQIIDTLPGIGNGDLGSIPTIVLMNEGSASASEIVAGALQDYGKAQLVGTKSYGKGSVQEYQGLSDGSAIKITVAEWLTPKERAINKVGLEPTILVERTDKDYEAKRDPQLDRARQLLSGGAVSTILPSPATAKTGKTGR